MPQILIFVIAGALAAAAFALVFAVLGPRIRGLASAPQWQSNGPLVLGALAAAVVFAVVFLALGGTTSSAASKEAAVLDDIRRYRFVQVLEKYQPDAKQKIEAMVHEAVSQNDTAIAQTRTTELVQQYFPQYVPTTSDDAIVGFATSLVDILTYFETNDVQTCKTLATGGRLSTPIAPDRMNPTLEAMADVIEAASTHPQPAPDAAKAQALVQSVVTKLYSGNDPKLLPVTALTTPQTAPADKLCHTMQSFYRTVLSLPKADASLVLRKLISGTK